VSNIKLYIKMNTTKLYNIRLDTGTTRDICLYRQINTLNSLKFKDDHTNEA